MFARCRASLVWWQSVRLSLAYTPLCWSNLFYYLNNTCTLLHYWNGSSLPGNKCANSSSGWVTAWGLSKCFSARRIQPPLCKVSGNICDILRSWWDTFSHLPRLAEETKTILFPEVNESCWALGAGTASCRLDRSGKLLDLQRNCLLQLGWIGNMAKNKSAKEINSDKQVRQIN